MLRTYSTLLIALAVAGTAFAVDNLNIPGPPDGYRWHELDGNRGTVLVPDHWHVSSHTTKDAKVYRVTKEKPDEKGRFLTGLTINIIDDVPNKTNVKPSVYAVKYVKEFMEGAAKSQTPQVGKEGAMQSITTFVNRKLPEVDDELSFRIRVTTFANDKTGTLYVILFGSPEKEWKNNYEIGKMLCGALLLNFDDDLPKFDPEKAGSN